LSVSETGLFRAGQARPRPHNFHSWEQAEDLAIPLAGTCMVFVLVLLTWLEAKIRLG
jgi:hypothetical protein